MCAMDSDSMWWLRQQGLKHHGMHIKTKGRSPYVIQCIILKSVGDGSLCGHYALNAVAADCALVLNSAMLASVMPFVSRAPRYCSTLAL